MLPFKFGFQLFVAFTMAVFSSYSRPQEVVNKMQFERMTLKTSKSDYVFSADYLLNHFVPTEKLSFDKIVVIKFIDVGLMVGGIIDPDDYTQGEVVSNVSPGENSPSTLWYINYITDEMCTIRSLLNPHLYMCMMGEANDAKVKLNTFDEKLCIFKRIVLRTRPSRPIAIVSQQVNSSSSSSQTAQKSLPLYNPYNVQYMALAFQNPYTNCSLAFDISNSTRFCLNRSISELDQIHKDAHFDMEKADAQLIFQNTISFKDVYPNHTNIDAISKSIETRTNLNRPFMLMDWNSGQTKPQYFTIEPDNLDSLKSSINKHRHHVYQIPQFISSSTTAQDKRTLQNSSTFQCSFNAYDLFEKRPYKSLIGQTTHEDASQSQQSTESAIGLLGSTAHNTDTDIETLQSKFDSLSRHLYNKLNEKLSSPETFTDRLAALESMASKLNSITRKIS